MEGGRKRRKYDREFKQGAIRLVEAGEKVAVVARNLGINENMLWRWISEAKQQGGEAFPGSGHFGAGEADVKRLQRELAQTQMERDILKKALAIFSTTPDRNTSL